MIPSTKRVSAIANRGVGERLATSENASEGVGYLIGTGKVTRPRLPSRTSSRLGTKTSGFHLLLHDTNGYNGAILLRTGRESQVMTRSAARRRLLGHEERDVCPTGAGASKRGCGGWHLLPRETTRSLPVRLGRIGHQVPAGLRQLRD